MYALLPLALALALNAPAPDESAGPRAAIDKAVKAVGGEAKLAGARGFSQKASGKLYGPAGAADFTAEWVVHLPGQARQTADTQSDGKTFHVVKVIAGDKGWLRVNDFCAPAAARREQRQGKQHACQHRPVGRSCHHRFTLLLVFSWL